MSDDTRSLRRYDESEVARILKRATELQRDEPTRGTPSTGMSLGELQEIAREAGIDPGLIRRAAREMDTYVPSTEGPMEKVVGAPLTLVYERTIAGEIPDAAFEELVLVIHRHVDNHGQPSLLGRTLTWQGETQSKMRTLQVIVSSKDGETDIRVEERLHQWASGLFGGTVAGGGGGLGFGLGLPVAIEVLGSAFLAVAFPVAALTLAYMLSREIYRAVVERRRRMLARLLEALSDAVEQAVPPQVRGATEPPRLTAE